jgi:hypothetical protein
MQKSSPPSETKTLPPPAVSVTASKKVLYNLKPSNWDARSHFLNHNLSHAKEFGGSCSWQSQ